MTDLPAQAGTIRLLLDPQEIVRTVDQLRDRIQERFPGSGLGGRAAALGVIARNTIAQLRWVSEPHLPLRIAIGLLIGVIFGILAGIFWKIRSMPTGLDNWTNALQVLDSVINDIFFVGASIVFVMTLESRIKRRRALRFIRELRALAHIVDMHQLTKDPDRLGGEASDTPSSPVRPMSRLELGRYLDYCSEMLSLISKLAALYSQNMDDPVVLAAVDEVEALTNGLSEKIWQKIRMLETQRA